MKFFGKLRRKYFIIFFLLITVSIGYAVLTANLGINGQFSLAESSFDVHFEKIEVINNPIEANAPTIDNNGTTITFLGDFDRPGDYYDFSVYAVNDGTIDATIDEIAVTGLTNEMKNYINYSLKYSDDSNVLEDDLLRAGSARKIKVHLEYKYDIDEFIPIDELELSLTIKYVSATGFSSNVWNYEYIGKPQTFYVPKTGTYKIELWGADGGNAYNKEAYNNLIDYNNGAYTSGNIELNKNDILYIYVGSKGVLADYKTIELIETEFNGGAKSKGQASYNNRYFGTGGGATDVRLVNGNWKNFDSLKSRIMVAAAGGGSIYFTTISSGGAGGGLEGYDGILSSYYGRFGSGGSQRSGGYTIIEENTYWDTDAVVKYEAGTRLGYGGFGYGGSSPHQVAPGGGSGYYGGGSAMHSQSAGGGSSYISGHNGCIAITEDSTENNINQRTGTNDAACTDGTTDSKCSEHYSGKVFTNTVMIDGKGYNWTTEVGDEVVGMPTHDGTGTMIGNVGDGYAKITYLGE